MPQPEQHGEQAFGKVRGKRGVQKGVKWRPAERTDGFAADSIRRSASNTTKAITIAATIPTALRQALPVSKLDSPQ